MRVIILISLLSFLASCNENKNSSQKTNDISDILAKDGNVTLDTSDANTLCLVIVGKGGGCENFDTSSGGGCDPVPPSWGLRPCVDSCSKQGECEPYTTKQKLKAATCQQRNELIKGLKEIQKITGSSASRDICVFGATYGSNSDYIPCKYTSARECQNP